VKVKFYWKKIETGGKKFERSQTKQKEKQKQKQKQKQRNS
jgi:hypothetical protein